MSNAWETTIDDVKIILEQHESNADPEEVFNNLDKEDFYRIEESALYGCNLEGQTIYAHEVLRMVLAEKGFIQ